MMTPRELVEALDKEANVDVNADRCPNEGGSGDIIDFTIGHFDEDYHDKALHLSSVVMVEDRGDYPDLSYSLARDMEEMEAENPKVREAVIHLPTMTEAQVDNVASRIEEKLSEDWVIVKDGRWDSPPTDDLYTPHVILKGDYAPARDVMHIVTCTTTILSQEGII